MAFHHGRLYEIRLNRAHRLNGFTDALATSVIHHIKKAEDDPNVRVLLMTATGPTFSCGMDLDDLLHDGYEAVQISKLLDTIYNPLIRKLASVRLPVVAALNGIAAGGAVGLVLAADFIVASKDAKLVSAFSKLGLVPDCGVSWAAVRKLGYNRAMAFSLLERTIDANEGMRLGVFTEVVGTSDLHSSAIELSEKLAATSAMATSLTKAAFNDALSAPLETQLETERGLQDSAFSGSDFMEGFRAFKEKRRPQF